MTSKDHIIRIKLPVVVAAIGMLLAFLLAVIFTIPAQTDQVSRTKFLEGEQARMEGLIVARSGDSLKLRDENGAIALAVLTDETEIRSAKAVLKPRKKTREATSLLPGLLVQVEGAGDSQGVLVVSRITFDTDDLKVAQQLNAGRSEQQAQPLQTVKDVATNRETIAMLNKRVSELDEYLIEYGGEVHFASNSTVLSPEARKTLDDLVIQGQGLEGYLIEVIGYADTSGSETRNQELSKRRAEAVVVYLEQVRRVPLRRILTPAGMGTTQAIASNASEAGRAQNRRVEVKVLVNRGMAKR